ncbi:glycoside hydrolase family 16 protein [Halorubellus salinus]|uniref:glycoside hydrolase family 16 protein n=1 Tax=Halorubellus salinus TaxID=755309 RepID=UPI001D08D7F2|nr:family 16 glycosylhydrolase [Halorubellus salinus]
MNRRSFLGFVSGTVLCSPTATTARSVANAVTARPTAPGWELVLDDRFESDELNRDIWSIGWGWGRSTSTSPTRIVPDNVRVDDDTLRLVGTHDSDSILSGAVNTKDKVLFEPDAYLEARLRFAHRTGFQNAFWSKANSEAWPPEIDVVERWQDRDIEIPRVTRHHLHYSSSMIPGDDSTHQNAGFPYTPGGDVSETFHHYGVEWRRDRIVHYVDGLPVRVWTDGTMLRAMARAAPFYAMLSLNINNIGTADTSVPWGESMDVDRVRLWQARDSADSETGLLNDGYGLRRR